MQLFAATYSKQHVRIFLTALIVVNVNLII